LRLIPKFGFGFERNSFFEMVKGFEGILEYIQHDYDRLTLIPSADYLVVEGTSQGRMAGKSWAGGKTPWRAFLQRLQETINCAVCGTSPCSCSTAIQ
jgi:hypothetical protein